MIYSHPYHQALSSGDYQDVAFAIGVELCKEAIWDQDKCNWIGPGLSTINGILQLTEKACSLDFYHGTSGISSFLTLLYKQTNDPIIGETLEGCFKQILFGFKTVSMESNLSFFEGFLGVAICLIKNGEILERTDLISEGLAMLKIIAKNETKAESLDLMGIAGAIPSLLRIVKRYDENWILSWMHSLGNHLIDLAKKDNYFWSWNTIDPQMALPGYAHGSSGIALALLELYVHTGEDHFLQAASMGFSHTQYLISAQNNDQSFNYSTQPIQGDNWCYGAPGIVLAFIRAWEHTGREDYKQVAEYAAELSYHALSLNLQQTYNHNYSLCHGLAGNADILFYAGQKFDIEKYQTISHYVAHIGYYNYFKTGINWPGGLNDPEGKGRKSISVPGFMLGISGTGYFYLRLSESKKVPFNLLIL